MKGIFNMSRLLAAALAVVGSFGSLGAGAADRIEFVHTDALGSPVAVTDENGVVIRRTEYEPYGAVVGGEVADGPGYTGHVSDSATGLSYMQQRYMDPGIGVFLSVDPVTAYQQPVVQFGRYRYGNSNPYKFTDPDGRESGAAFRVINNMTYGGVVSPPPRSPHDWLGPVIGASLAGSLALPAAGFGVSWGLANPATANSLGAGLADVAMGDALGGASVGTGALLVYRAVTAAELRSLKELGHFIPSPNGDSVKRFVQTESEAHELAKAYGVLEPHSVVQGSAPRDLIRNSTKTTISDVPGKPMTSINVPSNQAQRIRCTGTNIELASC